MGKVIVIGIDGLDRFLLSKFESDLPNFRKLKNEGVGLKMESVFPVDSVPAWASIYTGLNPANHGLLRSIDYLDKRCGKSDMDTGILPGRTYWDYAGTFGKKVCIINPFMAYPVWQVNGIMINGPVFIDGTVQAYPQSILEEYEVPHLGGIVGFPSKRELDKFCGETEKITLEEAEFGLKLLRDYDWDLYFICFLTLDRIQHFFWRYCFEDDPTYPGDNPYKNVIKDFYKLFDKIVGEFIVGLDSDTVIIVHSDHGHGMRSTKLLNINEILRRKGLLISRAKTSNYTNIRYLIERMKAKSLDFVHKHELGKLAIKLAKVIPKSKELQKSSFIIDMNESLAFASDFAGMTPCGGININLNTDKGLESGDERDYEGIRDLLIKELREIKDPDTGEKLVKWICRREEVYSGKYISKFPDIIFELNENYGVNWTIHNSIISANYTHKLISGGHKREGTFLVSNLRNEDFVRKNVTLMDIAPTILDLLDGKGNFNLDGKSIFKF